MSIDILFWLKSSFSALRMGLIFSFCLFHGFHNFTAVGWVVSLLCFFVYLVLPPKMEEKFRRKIRPGDFQARVADKSKLEVFLYFPQ